MAYLLGLAAAMVAALGAVLQRLALESAPAEASMRLSLMAHAMRRGIWFVGFACLLGQFALQASALRFGQLSVVQPCLTMELFFLVTILGLWFRRPLGWHEWLGAAGVIVGLATFFLAADPAQGKGSPDTSGWIAVGAITAVAVGSLLALARQGPRWWRATAFGASGAVLFAFNSSLTKALTTLITRGWGHVFVSWVPYALAVTGIGALFLLQNALHAGPITASRAAGVVVNPLVAIVFGVTVFAERMRGAPGFVVLEIVGLAAMCGGAILLARSPLIAGSKLGPAGDEFLGKLAPAAPVTPAT